MMTHLTPTDRPAGQPHQGQSTSAEIPSMDIRARLRRALRLDQDPLLDFRERVVGQLSTFAAVLVLPFVLNNLVAGRIPVAIAILVAQSILLANAFAYKRGRPPPVPMWVMVLTMVTAVMAAVTTQGLVGVFWAYPVLFICYFALPRRQALPLSVAMVLLVPALAALALPVTVAARIIATLGLTVVMINVVLNVIGDLQGALVAQAITDPLTGAFNRRHLGQQLERMVATPQDPRAPNALLAIDIDLFKHVNDRMGHAAGDAVLKAVVTCMAGRIRRADMLFRSGGEEFVLLLPRTSLEDAQRVAEDLRGRIEQAEPLPQVRLTVSIGVAMQRVARRADEWLRAADEALYEAKRNGRNRVELAAATVD